MIAPGRVPLVLAACIATAFFVSACTKAPASPSCSFGVSLPTSAFGPEGGTGSATVTAGSGCAWTAISSGSFVTVTSGATGTGNGSVQFTVAVNTGTDRTATLSIAGTAVTITQRALAPTLSAPSANSPIGGQVIPPGRPTLVVNNATATGSIGAVTYRYEVSDLPSVPADPVRTFTHEGVPQGTGTTSWVVNRDLGANIKWYWRALATDGAVTSAFSPVETFSTGPQCSYTLSPTAASLNGSGGTITVTVTTPSACGWTATTNDAFLTVSGSGSGSGTGNGTITVTAAANGGAARTGTVTVSGSGGSATFTLTQDVNCTYNPTPNGVTLTKDAATGRTFVVTTSFPTCAWRVASDSSWLVITAGDNNTGQGTVTFSVLENRTIAQRNGTVNITGFIGGSGRFIVTQQP